MDLNALREELGSTDVRSEALKPAWRHTGAVPHSLVAYSTVVYCLDQVSHQEASCGTVLILREIGM